MRDLEGIAGLEALAEADRALRPASGRPLTAEMQRLLLAAVTPAAWIQCSGNRTYEVREGRRRVAGSFPEPAVFALWGEGLLEQDQSIKSARFYTVTATGRGLARALQEASHG